MSEAREMVKKIHSALEDKKADDITVIDITEVSCLADYFIIAAGSNINQVQAMADNVDQELGKAGFPCKAMEGYQSGQWILLDFGDIVVHVFSRDDRRFYNLERIWRDGKFLSREDLD